MSTLRVLEAITPSRIGGAEVAVAKLCQRLPNHGVGVRLFCPAGRSFADYAAARGIEPISWRTRGKLDVVTLLRLRNLIKRRGFDLIHTHLSTASLLGALAAKLARRPSVAHVHGFNTATCFRYSTQIVAVSQAAKRHMIAQGMPEEKIAVIYSGVDVAEFRPVPVREAKKKLGFDPDEPLLGVFGRLSEEKGQRVAIEALYLLLEKHPAARLLLVGDGKDRSDLETCAQALGVADSVRFTGFADDVRPLMSACDIVLVPSLREGLGLAAAEAMALGRPVAASMVGGLPEVVRQRETGILVAPGDPKALASALEELLGSSKLRQTMGMCGRAVAEESFDLDKQVGKLAEFLAAVVAESGVRRV